MREAIKRGDRTKKREEERRWNERNGLCEKRKRLLSIHESFHSKASRVASRVASDHKITRMKIRNPQIKKSNFS